MKSTTLFLLVLVQSKLLLTSNAPVLYVIPEPKFEVLSPRGFSVSIPDEEGITLFSFHANLNEVMDGLEGGQFSKDITGSSNGYWVFQDHKTELKVGDEIYFWIFVVKDNLGYKYENGKFVVIDIVQEQPPNNPDASSCQPTTQSNSNDKTPPIVYSPMCEAALEMINTVDELKGDMKQVKETNDILKDIILKDDTASKTLKFGGILPPFEDAHYTAQIILEMKLGLHIPVVSARREKDKSITFQVPSLDDKLYVIKVAKEKLGKIKSKITLEY